MLQGRNLRTSLHQLPGSLQPKFVNHDVIQKTLQARQAEQVFHRDGRRPARVKVLCPGQIVRARLGEKWTLSKVVQHMTVLLVGTGQWRKFNPTQH